jgi:serine/alanine adding enzyme
MHSHDYYAITVDLSQSQAQARWDEYVDKHPLDGHHHYSSFLNGIKDAYGHETITLAILQRKDDRIVGVLPLVGTRSKIFGSQLTSIPFFNYGGPLYDNKEVLQLLLYGAEEHRRGSRYESLQLRCINNEISSVDSILKPQTHKACLILDLPDDVKKIGAGNAKKRAKLRSQSKLAERRAFENDVVVEQKLGGIELLDDFYSVFSKHMHALGTPVYGKDFFKSIILHIKSILTIVYWDGKPVGAGWLFDHGDQVSIPWASTLRDFNIYSINAYMYYNILSDCIEKGKKRFDFGRSTIDANTYKFKLQWGAEPIQCYWYTNDTKASEGDGKESFSLAVACWKKMPLWIANRLGPLIIKDVP